ncbi:hypothetical protein F5148DRAFT_1258178 [Russula earlei]|uniref:Uncharacterized protein n=1 Tax=Russula earlei TaxID=71964 RepID=A0ACC0TTB2_9AGAM|nr:hypothetical protein F5148DRAFT_1258178 [Russula earlei]
MRTTYVLAIFCLAVGIAPSLSLPHRLGNFRSNRNHEGAPPSSSDSNQVVPKEDSPSTLQIAVRSGSFDREKVVDPVARLRGHSQDDQIVAEEANKRAKALEHKQQHLQRVHKPNSFRKMMKKMNTNNLYTMW